MKKRSLALRALTTAVVVALLGTTALPALAAQPASAEPLALASRTLTAPAVSTSADFQAANSQLKISQDYPHPGGYYPVNTTIDATGGVGLTFTPGDNVFTSDLSNNPPDIRSGGKSGFYMGMTYPGAAGPYGFVAAQIFFNNKPTGYWAKMYVSDWTRTFKYNCGIYLGDPQLEATSPALTPFSCTVTKFNQANWRKNDELTTITFEVAPIAATVITDPIKQKQLLEQSCSEMDENCVYQPSFMASSESPQSENVGSVVSNSSDFPVHNSIKIMEKYSRSDSVGGSLSASFKLGAIIELKAKITFDREITQTRSITQTLEVEIPPLHSAWFTIGWQVETITGDFIIRQGSNLYRLSNVSVTSPSADKKPTIVPHNEPFLALLRPANK